jgi:catalase (peroxidase I)
VAEPQLWQDPVPAVDHELVDDDDIAALKATILDSGLSVPQLVSTAWAAAASFRGTDNRGGANGARIRLEPQRGWAANDPDTLEAVLPVWSGSSETSTTGSPAASGSPSPTWSSWRERSGRAGVQGPPEST